MKDKSKAFFTPKNCLDSIFVDYALGSKIFSLPNTESGLYIENALSYKGLSYTWVFILLSDNLPILDKTRYHFDVAIFDNVNKGLVYFEVLEDSIFNSTLDINETFTSFVFNGKDNELAVFHNANSMPKTITIVKKVQLDSIAGAFYTEECDILSVRTKGHVQFLQSKIIDSISFNLSFYKSTGGYLPVDYFKKQSLYALRNIGGSNVIRDSVKSFILAKLPIIISGHQNYLLIYLNQLYAKGYDEIIEILGVEEDLYGVSHDTFPIGEFIPINQDSSSIEAISRIVVKEDTITIYANSLVRKYTLYLPACPASTGEK